MSERISGGDALERRVLAFIGDASADDFGDLALAVFRRQFRDNADYRKLVELRGIDPESVTEWRDIPAVSTTAFKTLDLTCGPSNVVFRTSGTTRGPARRGEHRLPHTRVYEAALRPQFRKYVLPDRETIRMLAITPSPEWAPDSSLGFMVADVMRRFGARGSGFHLDAAGLRTDSLTAALRECEETGEAVLVLGTALAFVHFLETLNATGTMFRLPPGSRIMDTGGFKGETRATSREQLLLDYELRLGVPGRQVVNEYGMTELSSQFYNATLLGGEERIHIGPHWTRTLIIDPRTGLEATPRDRVSLQPGPVRAGILRHLDLANVHSVMAIETEDLAEIPGWWDGEGFRLTGRVPGSEPRGCSLAADDLPAERRHEI